MGGPSLYLQKVVVKGGKGAETQRHPGSTAKTIQSATQKLDQNQCQPAFTPTGHVHCVTGTRSLNLETHVCGLVSFPLREACRGAETSTGAALFILARRPGWFSRVGCSPGGSVSGSTFPEVLLLKQAFLGSPNLSGAPSARMRPGQ